MIKDIIKKIIRKYPKLLYMQKCISGLKNTEYMKLMSGEGGMIFRINETSGSLEERIAYKITINNPGDGFFALFRATMNYLYVADLLNLEPLVIWGEDVTYTEKNNKELGNNSFTYYFKQHSEYEESIYKYVIESIWAHQKIAENIKGYDDSGYVTNDDYISNIGKIIHKYVHLNDNIQTMLCDDMRNIGLNCINTGYNSRKWLGIHIRGTDYKQECKDHPVMLTIDDYYYAVDDILACSKYDAIFLATDDSEFQSKFINRYGEKVFYYEDVTRSEGFESVAFSKSNRQNHNFSLGYEVLRDVITLSMCDSFVGNLSQVSIGVRAFKSSRKEAFEILKILDKGVNKKGKTFERPY